MTAAIISAAANTVSDGLRVSIESDALISEYVSRATLNTLVEQVLSGGRPCDSVSAVSLLTRHDGFLLSCDHYQHTYAMTKDHGAWRIDRPLGDEPR
jgi:hypothetical protein